jgi:Protein of unknown function (DUF3147)
MKPSFQPQQLRKTTLMEYLLRFGFGGVVALAASAAGHAWGPRVGGLFLAFPALLPAGLLLVKEHDGRAAAADDARGALLGSLGMVGFGVAIWFTAERLAPWLSLTAALGMWVGLSVGAWWSVCARRSAPARTLQPIVRTDPDESMREASTRGVRLQAADRRRR